MLGWAMDRILKYAFCIIYPISECFVKTESIYANFCVTYAKKDLKDWTKDDEEMAPGFLWLHPATALHEVFLARF
jgi:hypothetical protein